MSALSIAYLAPPQPKAQASRLEQLFFALKDAMDRKDTAEALRLADAARRIAPRDPTIGVVNARLLMAEGEHEQALAVLGASRYPGALAARAEALCLLGRNDEALDQCRYLLSHYAVDCVRGLDQALNEICAQDLRYAGWVGLDSSGRMVGSAAPGSQLSWVSGAALSELSLPGHGESARADTDHATADLAAPDLASFRLSLGGQAAAPLIVNCSAGPLLGSPISWQPDFGYSGWVIVEDGELYGAVRSDWAQGRPTTLVINAAGQEPRRVALPAAAGDSSEQLFSIPLQRYLGGSVAVSLLLPNERLLPLIGSPVRRLDPHTITPVRARPTRRPDADAPAGSTDRAERTDRIERRVDIVVPVYAGRIETLRCIASVLDTVRPNQAELVVINDASPDAELCAELEHLAHEKRITLLVNTVNQGFPGAANRGLQLHPERDVVLLNADCEVYEDWLTRLRTAAYSSPDIGTVTPLGEQASIASYTMPSQREPGAEAAETIEDVDGAPGVDAESAARIDAIARQVNAGRTIDVPVGVGFCLYLRRSCLKEIGAFDERTYGPGYGEENDFCLRARQRGWRHVVAPNIFVRHSGGRSFGAIKSLLMARHSRVLNARHPGYDDLVAEHVARDPLRAARRAIDLQRLQELGRHAVLAITHALGGGVQRVVERRTVDLTGRGYRVLTLQPYDAEPEVEVADGVAGASPDAAPGSKNRPRTQGVQLQLAGHHFDNLRFEIPAETPALIMALRSLQLSGMEVHHFLHLPDPLIEDILNLGVGYRVFLHDYAWVCPRLTLLGGNQRYCGEPQVEACETCISNHGTAFRAEMSVAALRERSARWLSRARQVVCATKDVKARYARYFPDVPIAVARWEEIRPPRRWSPPAHGTRARIAVIGAINVQKGLKVLQECATEAAARDLALEFVLVGFSGDDQALLETGRIFITGPYEESELHALLKREHCQVAWFPSVTPETWCCTLSHAIAEGMPIVAFDIGAQAERLRGSSKATLIALTTPVRAINQYLLQAAAGRAMKPAIAFADRPAVPAKAPPAPAQPAVAMPEALQVPPATPMAPVAPVPQAAPMPAAPTTPAIPPLEAAAQVMPPEPAAPIAPAPQIAQTAQLAELAKVAPAPEVAKIFYAAQLSTELGLLPSEPYVSFEPFPAIAEPVPPPAPPAPPAPAPAEQVLAQPNSIAEWHEQTEQKLCALEPAIASVPAPVQATAPAPASVPEPAPSSLSATLPDPVAEPAALPMPVPTAVPAPEPAMQAETTPTPEPVQATTPDDAFEQTASVQMLSLPPGVYAFAIESGAAAGEHGEAMSLPALHVGLAPVQAKGQVFFFPGPRTLDCWLAFAGDQVVARVVGDTAGLLLTSLRRIQDPALGIHVRRLDTPLTTTPSENSAEVPAPTILVHVRALGDLYYPAASVGPFGPELWIESYVVDSKAPDGASSLLEYRGLTADGFETPWLSDSVLCGSRGRGTPLLGFAVRPRVLFAYSHGCTYFGLFQSGRRVGPISAGNLCRSDQPDDPLVGMELQVELRE